MSLVILVISGRESDREVMQNGHVAEFRQSGLDGNGKALDLSAYDFAFVHLNNHEAPAAIEAWQQVHTDAKVIGFSGGAAVPRRIVKWDLPFLSGIGALAIVNLNWAAVPTLFRGSAADLVTLLTNANTDLLSATAILCQGCMATLAVDEDCMGGDVFRQALDQMGWRDEHNQYLSGHSPALSDLARWLDVLLPNGEGTSTRDRSATLKTELAVQWGAESLPLEVERLVQVIGGEEKGPIADIVSSAYISIARRLGTALHR
jgi:hypothetical protein